MAKINSVSLQDIVGRGYADFWNSKKRYVVCKGSRASKKSTTAALKIIVRMMQYPESNTLVIRQTAESLKDSCYAQLLWAIDRLGVASWWRATKSPLEIEYIPTGQRILFRGLDNPLKVTSITVKHGYLCYAWLEEAYEVSEDAFNRIDESLRGQMPDGYYIQWLITLNPWDAGCWIKHRFFDTPRDNVLAMTTTYKCNEWLSDADMQMFEEMKLTDPERYKVAGLAEWGIAEGQYFTQWRESLHVVDPFEIPRNWMRFRAMDWGSAHPYAVLWFAVDYDGNLWCYREMYGWGGKPNVGTNETARQVGEHIAEVEMRDENVSYGVLDNACWAATGVTGPTVAEELNNVLYEHKLVTFGKSSKGRMEGANAFRERLVGNTNNDGTTKPAIYFFRNCIHTIRTIPMLAHDKHKPELPDTQGEDHCFIAGTMIATSRGNIPIEEVTLDDYVLTRKGYRRVLASGKTKENAEVMTAYFSDGSKLTATKNHPVFIEEKGFVPLDTIPYGGIIYSIKEVQEQCQGNRPKQQIVSCLMELPLGATHFQKECQIGDITEQTAGYENKESATCTMKYGRHTTEKFQKVFTYITKMGIRSITTFQISNCCREVSTCHTMLQTNGRILRSTSLKFGKASKTRQRSGINLRQAENGMSSTLKRLLKKNTKSRGSKQYALYVEKNISCFQAKHTKQNSAQMRVMQDTDVLARLTMRIEPAQYAEKHLASINTASKKLVEKKNAVSVVCLQTEKEKHDVYNLTVDEVHEYFANGILVHNCYDSVAYACLSRPWTPARPKKSRPVDAWNEKPTKSAWTY